MLSMRIHMGDPTLWETENIVCACYNGKYLQRQLKGWKSVFVLELGAGSYTLAMLVSD